MANLLDVLFELLSFGDNVPKKTDIISGKEFRVFLVSVTVIALLITLIYYIRL